MLHEVGFDHTQMVRETGFNSSPVTRGVLIRAVKPATTASNEGDNDMGGLLNKYQEFFDGAYKDGALSARTKILISLGASLGAGCEP